MRRFLDQCTMGKDKQVIFLALDWARAFDSVAPELFVVALSRFGIPSHFIKIVEAVYSKKSSTLQRNGHHQSIVSSILVFRKGVHYRQYCSQL